MFLPNYWLTTIKVDSNETGFSALQLMQHLAKADIETRPLWKPIAPTTRILLSPSYVNGISEALFNCGLCLPSGPMVTVRGCDACGGCNTEYDREYKIEISP